MAKLYFKYGAMGSSKSAQALITKFNYEEKGMKVWLIKPSIDTREDLEVVSSRIGLKAKCTPIFPDTSIWEAFESQISRKIDVIIADESQFFTAEQIDDMRKIVDELSVPVLCFGLRTDFRTNFFEGSKRLFEVADKLTEIKNICECGRKAIVNARIDDNGNVITEGEQVLIGGEERYTAMCHNCWRKAIASQE
ncbi:MAG: thymidine kinase [Clostridia bacterium]|nr:thymidine kinase [Clostridia bacterium]